MSSNGQVLGVVLFYMLAALSLIFANKWVLNNTSVPLFFLLTQLILASLLFILSHTFSILPKSSLPSLNLSPKKTKALMPMILLNVIGLSLTTSTLKHLDASFYQVATPLLRPRNHRLLYRHLPRRHTPLHSRNHLRCPLLLRLSSPLHHHQKELGRTRRQRQRDSLVMVHERR